MIELVGIDHVQLSMPADGEAGFRPLAKAHPALVVRDLAAARTALASAGVTITEDDAGLPVRRCYVHDPLGNRIELVDARDAGFSAR